MTDEASVSADTVTLHDVRWNRCRRCRRLRPLQRLEVPRYSEVVDTNPPYYQYECRDRVKCDAVHRALERLAE